MRKPVQRTFEFDDNPRVRVVLGNRITTLQKPYPKELEKFFRYRPDRFQWMPKYKYGGWDGYIRLLKRGSVSTGLFTALQSKIEAAGVRLEIIDQRKLPKFKRREFPDARHYQTKCVDAMIDASNTGGILLAATAAGKTRMAGMYCTQLQGRACFVVDELMLLYQAQAELASIIGETVGTIGDSQFKPQRITVATVQTLALHQNDSKFRDWFKSLDVVIIDEYHTALNNRMLEALVPMTPAAIFGITATLDLKKAHIRLPAHALAGPVVYEYPLEQGTNEGFLSPGFVVGIQYVQRGYKSTWHSLYEFMIASQQGRNDLIVDLAEEAYGRGKSVVVLLDRVVHLRHISERLRHIPHNQVYGHISADDRMTVKSAFKDKDVRLLIANKVFTKGVDLPNIDVIIDGAAMSGKNLAIQKYGRGIRQALGKRGLIYFDVMDRSIPEAENKKHKHWNIFHDATEKRISAYRSRGIIITLTYWSPGKRTKAIFDAAETRLSKMLTTKQFVV